MEPRSRRNYPFSENHQLDLDPQYRELRRDEPVCPVRLPFGDFDAWLIARYEDVKTVLSDPRFSRAAAEGDSIPRIGAVNVLRRPSVMTTDPPKHTRLRKLVSKAFTARQVEKLRSGIQENVDGLLDDMVAKGQPADLMEDLAAPLSIWVICELLGVPFEDRHDFRRWSEDMLLLSPDSADRVRNALDALDDYLAGLVAQRRKKPTDDLLGVLVQARDGTDALDEDELVEFGVVLLVGGHGSTMNQIGNFVFSLLTAPTELKRLQENPALLPNAIEELLRHVPFGAAVGVSPRVATEDVELSGVTIRAGEVVLPAVASANRDEEVFDDPERLDIGRERKAHLAFGHGPHHCLGAQLARMELQITIETLLARFPTLALAVPPEQVKFMRQSLLRGPEELPVVW
ncbi:cytochrome P450 [Saccharopolyspora phatthalungensis]|uniref:Cytochrome P450 RapN n=1 Tax=Saccharopolyspora phatthalungensis TaxID=664693 RepID=A0A840QJ41_9PSEU|nr:cytochrome P450 [Saccharopolyspora phatthalungensis]MBB5158879.1 cytochrome P450 RapN [Saccharopolyspora phatthalungensis]